MRQTNFMGVAAAAVAVGVLLAGCGSGSDTEPGAGGDAAAPVAVSAGGVDRAALDTGDFPTIPQPAYGAADPKKAIWIEGQRMAEFVVLPFEVDPELTQGFGSTGPMTKPSDLTTNFGEAGADMVGDSLVAGYKNVAKEPGGVREFTQIVLRLTDEAAATSAAEQIHNILVTKDNGWLGTLTEEVIDVLPNTYVSSKELADPKTGNPVVSIGAFTAHGSYLLYSSAWVPVDQKDWTARAIAKSLELQEPLIDQFPATPVEELKNIKMDQDNVLIYAIPRPDGAISAMEEAVYGQRGMAQLADDRITDASRFYALLEDTGTDRIAFYATGVYRSASPESAQRLLDGLVAASRDAGWVDAPAPIGLPNAKCIATADGGSNACWVVNGRYVGQSTSGTKQKVDQTISAQYLILDNAK